MTNRAWAVRFMRDVLYEVNAEYRDGVLVHRSPLSCCERTAHRHFSREIRLLARRLSQQYERGWREKP